MESDGDVASTIFPFGVVVERGDFNAFVGYGNESVQVVISIVRHLEVGAIRWERFPASSNENSVTLSMALVMLVILPWASMPKGGGFRSAFQNVVRLPRASIRILRSLPGGADGSSRGRVIEFGFPVLGSGIDAVCGAT